MAATGTAAHDHGLIHTIGSSPAGRLATLARWMATRRVQRIVLQVAFLLVVALLTRIAKLGDPTITGDEQFYLLVGDRMWQGALPFVDIWDRKPIGLFLLYALFRPFSTDGVLAYQVAALLFAAATAFVLAQIATRLVNPVAATIAGALYLVYLPIMGGAGGQSPVFYNLFTAVAALLVIRCMDGVDGATLRRHGLVAMLLTGLAMQVKYTALFEGIAFGLTLLWLHWRALGSLGSVATAATSLAAVALMPTALAFGAYAIEGHAWVFVSTNFISIFQKSPLPGFSAVETFLVPSAFKMAPLLLLASMAAIRALFRRPFAPQLVFALLWSAFAFVEFFALGRYSDHYAIPMLMPLVVVLASFLDFVPLAFAAPSLVIVFAGLIPGAFSRPQALQDQVRVAALTEALAPYARQGCIYVNDGPPILYLTTHSCLPTRYVFASHLADADEAAATDATASMAALLRGRPSAIVVPDRPRVIPRNAATDALLDRALAADYRLDKVLPDVGSRNQRIFVRNDLRNDPR